MEPLGLIALIVSVAALFYTMGSRSVMRKGGLDIRSNLVRIEEAARKTEAALAKIERIRQETSRRNH